MQFKYLKNSKVTIDGKINLIRMEDGMTGIGSRAYWINDKTRRDSLILQSENITKGNHFLYKINWGACPWEVVDILISAEELPFLLNAKSQPSWRNPIKLNNF